MANPHARLIDLRERLLACGEDVPARAEAFARERAGLLAELDGALSWRGLLGRAHSAGRLAPRVEGLCVLGQALAVLCERVGQVEQSLAVAAGVLGRIAAPALREAGGVPARLERLKAESGRLGRQVATDDALEADERRCEAVQSEAARLAEALGLWRGAEETLARLRASPRTAALEASLPELAGRLCRGGPTPEWLTEFKTLAAPLEQRVHRAEPREIAETEKIIKALPRWARALGEPGEACELLTERFKARRRDWPGEDDRTFAAIFEEARVLEQGLVERAAALRRESLADLAGRCGRFAELVESDAPLEALVAELRAWTPEDPRDHEDWCLRLREANAAFQNRVKRSENALLAALGDALGECRERLAALETRPRLDAQDDDFTRLRERCEALCVAARGREPEALLCQVGEARALRDALDGLGVAMGQAQADLARAAAGLRTRAGWLVGRARGLGIRLPAAFGAPAAGSGPEPGVDLAPREVPGAGGGLESARRDLEAEAGRLAAAEAAFAGAATTEGTAAGAAADRLLALIAPERVRSAGLETAVAAPEPADLAGLADWLQARRARLGTVRDLAAGEEREQTTRVVDWRGRLAAIDPEPLAHQDRTDREAVLRELAGWSPAALDDPAARLAALADLIENARHLERRIAAAARRVEERRADLTERLRRFNAQLLHGHCPDLYARVEALVQTPAATRWPRGAEEAQLAEAGRLLALLERAAGRLAARALAETAAALERRVRREGDAAERALLAEVLALPPDEPPPAGVRRRLADWALESGEGGA